jgi:hypothetical protein
VERKPELNWHQLFGSHAPDLKFSHWDGGHFVTKCTTCGREMVKPPGASWCLRNAGKAA